MRELVSAPELAEQVGVTYRNLDYWIRQGWLDSHVAARGSGSHRWFTIAQVRHAALMVRLVRAGITPSRASGLAVALARTGSAELAPDLWLITVPAAAA